MTVDLQLCINQPSVRNDPCLWPTQISKLISGSFKTVSVPQSFLKPDKEVRNGYYCQCFVLLQIELSCVWLRMLINAHGLSLVYSIALDKVPTVYMTFEMSNHVFKYRFFLTSVHHGIRLSRGLHLDTPALLHPWELLLDHSPKWNIPICFAISPGLKQSTGKFYKPFQKHRFGKSDLLLFLNCSWLFCYGILSWAEREGSNVNSLKPVEKSCAWWGSSPACFPGKLWQPIAVSL